jgi:two-component system, cell cycle response regulator DivK
MRARIALVEDNPDNRLLVHAILEDHFEVVEFENGSAALESFANEVPDLVLLDISLPGMDGTEVFRRMQEDERLAGVPVVALTAHAMAGDRERFLALGFDAYLTKPIVDEDELVGTIREHLTTGAE